MVEQESALMATVEMTDQEWQAAVALISQGPWVQANPLLNKIVEQLRQQAGTGLGRPNGPLEASEGLELGKGRQRPS